MTTTTAGDRLVDGILAVLADYHTKTTIAPDMPNEGDLAQFMKFVNWDHRPAVILDRDTAFAVLRPDAPWVSVDRWDVGQTAGIMSEIAWRRMFRSYGSLDLTKIGDPSASTARPKPTAKDFDDAVLAVMAADRQHKLMETLNLAMSVVGGS